MYRQCKARGGGGTTTMTLIPLVLAVTVILLNLRTVMSQPEKFFKGTATVAKSLPRIGRRSSFPSQLKATGSTPQKWMEEDEFLKRQEDGEEEDENLLVYEGGHFDTPAPKEENRHSYHFAPGAMGTILGDKLLWRKLLSRRKPVSLPSFGLPPISPEEDWDFEPDNKALLLRNNLPRRKPFSEQS